MIQPKIPQNPYPTRPMIIGEGEGKTEIEQGEYFVGKSGTLLNSILSKLGLERDKIYINNVVRFESIDEIHTPTPKDIEQARPRLFKEINEYKPKVILLLGAVALRAVLKKNGIKKYRGMLFTLQLDNGETAIVLPTLHPSAILRDKRNYDIFYHDIVKFKDLVLNSNSREVANTMSDEIDNEYTVISDINSLSNTILGLEELIERKSREEGKKVSIALDIETNKLSAFESDSHIVSIACYSNEKVGRFAVSVTDTEFEYKVIELLKVLLENENVILIVHNALFDLLFIQKLYGIEPRCRIYDTQLFQYLYNENTDRGLKRLVSTYFSVTDYSIIESKKGIDFNNTTTEQILYYNFQDAYYTWKLAKLLLHKLQKQKPDTLKYYTKIMEPLIPILIDMRIKGMKLDLDYLQQLEVELQSQLETLRLELELQAKSDMGVDSFNINSTKQIAEYLFNYLQVEPLVFTNTNAPSINKEALDKLLSDSLSTPKNNNQQKAKEFIEKLKEYKKLGQAYKLYVKQMKEVMDSHGYVHTALRLDGTVTGRLSSNSPNLQNISRNEKIKKLFIPRSADWYIGENDLSQIELRVLAFMSKDPTMMNAYLSGQDLHKATASKVFGIPFDQVTKEQRTKAKSVNFGISYMQSAKGLAENLNISTRKAEQLINDYFRKFPKVKRFIDEVKELARLYNYVKMPFGKYRHLPEIKSSINNIRSGAERQAVNFMIQSTASALNLLGIIELNKRIKEQNLSDYIFIVNTVHDSVVLEFHKDLLYDLAKLLKSVFWVYLTDIMIELFGNGIIKSDFKYGKSWGDTVEFDFNQI